MWSVHAAWCLINMLMLAKIVFTWLRNKSELVPDLTFPRSETLTTRAQLSPSPLQRTVPS